MYDINDLHRITALSLLGYLKTCEGMLRDFRESDDPLNEAVLEQYIRPVVVPAAEREWELDHLARMDYCNITDSQRRDIELGEGFIFLTSTDVILALMERIGLSHEDAATVFFNNEPPHFFYVEDYSAALAALAYDRQTGRPDDGLSYSPNRVYLYDPRDVEAWLSVVNIA